MTELGRMALALDTPRLLLRAWTADDTAWHRELAAERGDGPPDAASDAAVVANLVRLQGTHGVVPSVVVERTTGEVIGYTGLVVGRSSVEEPELAYELFRRWHGRGLATEAARAVLAQVPSTGRRRLWSTVRPWNAPSLRVLSKLGFRRERVTSDDRGEIVWHVRELAD